MEFEQAEELVSGNTKNSGILVETRTGVKGIVYYKDSLHFGKCLVYGEDGTKLLCDPRTLTVTGFVD